MRIVVDWDLCQGHGVCAEEAPEVLGFDEDECRVVILQETPTEALRGKVAKAVQCCPTRALVLED